MGGPDRPALAPPRRSLVGRLVLGAGISLERWWDRTRRDRHGDDPPRHLRIEPYIGHGTHHRVVVSGRLLADREPPAAAEGEGVWAAMKRTIARFTTDEVPGVAVRVRVGAAVVDTTTDDEGYFRAAIRPDLPADVGHWATGLVELAAPHRGVEVGPTVLQIRLSGPGTGFGVVSDVDDTIMRTGAQRLFEMVRVTLTGSEVTRTPFPGAAELYRALAAGDANPIFYVSSSPWNLHGFLTGFLGRRSFPLGPLLLRDLLGSDVHRSHAATKSRSIDEVLDAHPQLSVVLIGDSGQHDPEIYAEVVRRHPHRVIAVYIREVRLDPGDGRVEAVSDAWRHDVPFVLAADSAVVAAHAAELGLISPTEVDRVERAVARHG